MGKANSNYNIQKSYLHSKVTISAVFYKILHVFLIFHKNFFILLICIKLLGIQIQKNTKYFFYFENCIDILNNIHLLAHILAQLAFLYQNKKSWLFYNILEIY